MRTKMKFDWHDFLKSVSAIAIPVALQNLLTTTGSMVDTMMIAPLGENAVGAVGLCAQFATLFFSCYWGFVGGGMLFFSQYWGAKDEKGLDRAYSTTMLFMMTVALIFFSLGCFLPDKVMFLYTDKSSIRTIGEQYLHVAAFAYPLQAVTMAMSALLRTTGQVRIPLYGGIASVVTNCCLNVVFIYGKLGFPAMGVAGAALATVVSSAVNLLVIIVMARVRRYPYLFHFVRNARWTRVWMKEYLKKCFPIICNELLVGVGFTVNNIVLGRQSEASIAALAVFRTMEGLVIAFFAGFANAASVLVGHGVGAGEPELAYERAKRLVYLCGSCIALVCALIFSAHAPLLRSMGLSGESFRIGRTFVAIYCFAAVIRMCNWTQTDIFRAGGDTSFGTILEVSFMYALVIPAVCVSGLVLKWPVALVFACCYIDEPLRFLLMQIHLYGAKWIKPVTEQGREALREFLETRKG